MLKLAAIGNLGKDCVINTVGNKQVINFSIAHTEKFTSNGEAKEKTTWVECAYWSDSKVGAYLKKGTQVYVEGTPELRTYPKNDGTTGTSLTLRVGMVQLLGGGNKQEDDMSKPGPVHNARTAAVVADSEDLPF